MNKLAGRSLVGVLCALALVSSSAGSLPLQPSASQPAASFSSTVGAGSIVPEKNDGGAATPVPSGASTAPAASDNGKASDLSAAVPATAPPEVAPATVPPEVAAEPAAPGDPEVGQELPLPDASRQSVADPADSTPPVAAPAPVPAPLPGADETADEAPSIPPLWAPDAELGKQAATSAAPESELVQSQALVGDSNAAAILTVFNKINEYRVSRGLAKVKYHATVASLAQTWSDNIASREVIEHRPNFWTDPRALNPNNGAGEVIAIRTDRDAAMLVEWWKTSPGHNAMLLDPRFNVMGAGISYTDRLYQIWGVVNFFGYTTLPAGTTDAPGNVSSGEGTLPAPPPSNMCEATAKHMPPTLNLSAAAITGPADLVSVNAAGQLVNRPSLGGRNFAASRVIGSGFTGAKEVFTLDWDRNGTYDLLTQWTNGNLTLHRGLANGGFRAPVTLGAGGWDSLSLAVGTWCANNRMPQILALDAYGSLFLYPNRGLGDLAARATVATGLTAKRISMVDYDADGFQDLLGLRTDGSVRLYRGGGTIGLRKETRPTVATGWSDVTGVRPLRSVTGLNSTGVALRRANNTVQYWDLSTGRLAAPSTIAGTWAGTRLAQ